MPKSLGRRKNKLARPPRQYDNAGNDIGNLILRSLPRGECTQVLSSLEFVRLRLHQVLHEKGETIKSGMAGHNQEQMELNAKVTCPTCGTVHESTFPFPPKAPVPPVSAP